MKKRLNADALMEEFQNGSAFFRKAPRETSSPLMESAETAQRIPLRFLH